MTKKLQELFQLPDVQEETVDAEDKPYITPEDVGEITTSAYSNLEKIENALPQVRGLEASDTEMDELATLAIDSFNDLKDLGMQVDSRFSAEIFSAAGTMLGHAITARTAKINKKLKTIELQLKKAALDQKTASQEKELDNVPAGDGKIVFDRNELLKSLVAKTKDQ